ncbi:RNA recognition motif domain-containing protein [Streptomyces orinoci]|uniref:RNA-binding protein n=1 Tax=Streptomyces orinoci TaxID=67339 RepID=A0ABV3K1M5_STRON|nr:RNA-binding protein [Streptomyces orinoci]
MSVRVYVGNLSWKTTDETLREAFSDYGELVHAEVIMDRQTGRSRGFGFVSFDSAEEAEAAVNGMQQQNIDGRSVVVNFA